MKLAVKNQPLADKVYYKTKFKTPFFSDSVSKSLSFLTPDPIFQNDNHKVFQDQTWWPGSRVIFTLWTSRRVIKPPVFALNILLGRRMSLPLHCGKNWRCQLREIAIYRKHFTFPSSFLMKKKITIPSLTKKITIRSHLKSDSLSPLYRRHSISPASFPATVIFSQSRITFLLSRTSPPVSTGFRCPRYWFTLSHNVNITEQTKQQESILKKNPFRRATSGPPIVGHRRTLIMLFTFAREQCRTR